MQAHTSRRSALAPPWIGCSSTPPSNSQGIPWVGWLGRWMGWPGAYTKRWGKVYILVGLSSCFVHLSRINI
jgi:hypothetical protein